MTSFYCLEAYKVNGSNFLEFNAYIPGERSPGDKIVLKKSTFTLRFNVLIGHVA